MTRNIQPILFMGPVKAEIYYGENSYKWQLDAEMSLVQINGPGEKMENKNTGYLYIFIAAILWGCIGPVAKVAFAEGMNPLEVAFWRAAFAGIAFTGHGFIRKQYGICPRDLSGIVAFAFFCIALFFCSYQVAVAQGGAALASVLLYTAPAWVVLLARLFLNEKLTWLRCFSVALSILGAIAVGFGAGGTQQVRVSFLAVACGVFSGFSYGMNYIFVKKFLQKYPGSTIFMYAIPFALVFMAPFVPFSVPSLKAVAALIFLGIFSTYVPYLLYYRSLENIDASRVAIVATLEPVVAAVMAFIFWSESFSLLGYIGGILILCGVFLTIMEKK